MLPPVTLLEGSTARDRNAPPLSDQVHAKGFEECALADARYPGHADALCLAGLGQ